MDDKVTVKASGIYREVFLKELEESFKECLEGKVISLEEFEEKVLKKKPKEA